MACAPNCLRCNLPASRLARLFVRIFMLPPIKFQVGVYINTLWRYTTADEVSMRNPLQEEARVTLVANRNSQTLLLQPIATIGFLRSALQESINFRNYYRSRLLLWWVSWGGAHPNFLDELVVWSHNQQLWPLLITCILSWCATFS